MLDPFRVRFKAAARALCGFRGELALGRAGDIGDDRAVPGFDAVISDDADIVLGPIGTDRLLMLRADVTVNSGPTDRGTRFSGILSAGEISRPRAAAIIWWSAQFSLKSSSPRQNGANFLSI